MEVLQSFSQNSYNQLKQKTEDQKSQEIRIETPQRMEMERQLFFENRTKNIQSVLSKLNQQNFKTIIQQMVQLLTVILLDLNCQLKDEQENENQEMNNIGKYNQNKEQILIVQHESQEQEFKCKYEAQQREKQIILNTAYLLYEKGIDEVDLERFNAEFCAELIEQLKKVDDSNKVKPEIFNLNDLIGSIVEDNIQEKDQKEQKSKKFEDMLNEIQITPQRNIHLKQSLQQVVLNEISENLQDSNLIYSAQKENQFENTNELESYKNKTEIQIQYEDYYENINEESIKFKMGRNIIFAGELLNCELLNSKQCLYILQSLCEGTTPDSVNENNMEALSHFLTSTGEFIMKQSKVGMQQNLGPINKGDFLQLAKSGVFKDRSIDIVYLAPPWGGLRYKKQQYEQFNKNLNKQVEQENKKEQLQEKKQQINSEKEQKVVNEENIDNLIQNLSNHIKQLSQLDAYDLENQLQPTSAYELLRLAIRISLNIVFSLPKHCCFNEIMKIVNRVEIENKLEKKMKVEVEYNCFDYGFISGDNKNELQPKQVKSITSQHQYKSQYSPVLLNPQIYESKIDNG